MKRLFGLGVLCALTVAPVALAAPTTPEQEHRFACRNEWRQEKAVVVKAASVDDARRLLKTDPKFQEYNQCSYMGVNQIKSKGIPFLKSKPTESADTTPPSTTP